MTTSSGSKSSTNCLACVSAPSMSSRRSCDGPGRLSRGLWDIQHRASDTVSSRCQGEDVEYRGTRLRGELSNTCARDTAIGTQEQHGFLVAVEPGLELAGPVADDSDVGIIVAVPVQLGQWPGGDELRAQRLPVSKCLGAQYLPRIVVPAHDGEPAADNVVEQHVLLLSGVHPGLDEQRPDGRIVPPRFGVHDGAMLVSRHRLESDLEHQILERRATWRAPHP